ncbi:RAD protein (Pv-fam-e) [Plasmodium ovale curtisi]|uniref:RAD protein (Pv-fam-e) n=1 Tax=Plasmodium ovale curtisi TaxID=864141 RepID=A0A1A8WGZ9_PLAOA|nr:RAD protein (Pv-fam-e) [Plasmodium ovale curtisi]
MIISTLQSYDLSEEFLIQSGKKWPRKLAEPEPIPKDPPLGADAEVEENANTNVSGNANVNENANTNVSGNANVNENANTNVSGNANVNENADVNENANMNTNMDANMNTNMNENIYPNANMDENIYPNANMDENIYPNANMDANMNTNVDANMNTNVDANMNTNMDANIYPNTNMNENVDARADEYEDYSEDAFGTGERELPFGCKPSDINKKVNKWKLLKMRATCGPITVSRKKAFIVFYHFNQYRKKKFNNMITKLSRRFAELTKRSGIPEESRMQYWLKCYPHLSIELEKLERHCERLFFALVKEGKVPNNEFQKFLKHIKNIWKMSMKKNEQKWFSTLSQQVAHYRRENVAITSFKYRNQNNPNKTDISY